MRKIEIEVDAAGRGKVILDGHDISPAISGFNLRVRAGRLTTMFIKMDGLEVKAKGEARDVR